ncbi:hypothetical protein [Chryseobacterium sp. R2A-55]|uniref:hypothetical protein n=1 Tax=Chryseobacterium sp. R2A-55 TaxID=2744445 RepID=UPI001F256E06|nr:hypothetical protein [Chryseobacterium sp. R2A-55]
MKDKYIGIAFSLFSLFVFIIVINYYLQSKKELKNEINFIITKIEVSPTKSLILYSNNREVKLWNYDIRDYEDVKVGDLVRKNKFAKELLVLRKNKKTGKYNVTITLMPSGIISE